MKKQVVVIHGGDTFETYEEYLNFLRGYEIDIERYKSDKSDWKPWLRQGLGGGHEVILPIMPNKTNARFDEWKIWFEKFTPFLHDGAILIGHSLGGTFLAKYLSENRFPKKIKAVFLVGAVFSKDNDGFPYWLRFIYKKTRPHKTKSGYGRSPEGIFAKFPKKIVKMSIDANG